MKISETHKLAQWWVTQIIRRTWTRADWHGTHAAHASRLLKMGYKMDEIQGCALAMVKNPGTFSGWTGDYKLEYMAILLKGEPPYIEQWLRPPDPPPVYEARAYDEWVMNWGKKAIRLGLWDGVYGPLNEPHRLNEKAIRIILGDEYYVDALSKNDHQDARSSIQHVRR